MKGHFDSSKRKRMPPVSRALLSLFASVAFLFGSVAVRAQGGYAKLAGEYSLSGALPGDQTRPALAFGPSGGYVVWQDNVTDGDGSGISAQRLNDNLSGTLAPFRVNQLGAGHQECPQAAALPNGGAVFVWQGGALGFQKIYARFLNPDGTFATGDILVGTDTNQPSLNPAVAVLAGGEVLVAWSRMEGDGHLQGVCARRLSAAGALLGPEWVVNQASLYNQTRPALAALAGGGFVVAWVSESVRGVDPNILETLSDSYAVDILARRYDAAGAALGNEFKVNTSPVNCDNPALAATPDGGFTIVWEQRSTVRTNSLDILARSHDAAGAPVTAPVVVNATTYGDQYAPRITTQGDTHLVLWTSLGQDGSYEGVYGRILTVTGAPTGDEFLINSTTLNRQIQPALGADNAGRLLVVWSSFTGVAAGCDLYAQRYASAQPVPTPAAPSVSAISQSRLAVSWAELAGYDLAHYAVYVDGSATPITTTNQLLVVSNLVAGSTHTFRMEHVLRDGRRSALSATGSGQTWGEDANFDGLPDDWQSLYWGLNPLGWPAAGADSDGDGATNVQEFLAGTNPASRASALRLDLMRNAQGLWLNWNTEPGFVYQVQFSTNAVTWQSTGSARFAPGTVDAVAVGGSDVRLYRIIRMR
ncbi:MAG: Uncharacterized protein FD161_2582 [Limisphaerales bacterium]|nr:MAG: Uncharacterized protein FD161_2582 [Limisphaerales bacterium]KAG0508504.1 MAG: Uncharacterized protein E1N63_2333 [Limisphaerales bacterium]TXT48930.1 MAG: Uncharacterized protein FD140_3398 [Limisphaerales bacterium]